MRDPAIQAHDADAGRVVRDEVSIVEKADRGDRPRQRRVGELLAVAVGDEDLDGIVDRAGQHDNCALRRTATARKQVAAAFRHRLAPAQCTRRDGDTSHLGAVTQNTTETIAS